MNCIRIMYQHYWVLILQLSLKCGGAQSCWNQIFSAYTSLSISLVNITAKAGIISNCNNCKYLLVVKLHLNKYVPGIRFPTMPAQILSFSGLQVCSISTQGGISGLQNRVFGLLRILFRCNVASSEKVMLFLMLGCQWNNFTNLHFSVCVIWLPCIVRWVEG